MTKHLTITILLFLLISCNQNGRGRSNNDTLSSNQRKDTISNNVQEKTDSISSIKNDTSLISFSNNILKLIKNKEYAQLSQFIHPQLGIRFSPYGVADTVKNQRLSAQQFLKLNENKKIINWGTFEGTGEPINLSLNNYFKRFAYDVDFMTAEKKSVNKIIGSDSSSSNITSIYPDCDFVQYYFSGFNKKYEGMDWKSLVLVFRKGSMKTYLVAIMHDEWKV